ncbi:right-handed parallel beta-helix repeat-containing protein [Streptomyces nojiriensis]|uniref:right-handed parallel beta-helix repeat-containing protein n=1 Tax=Streptomyces nojiriensis TaxID=66374 RepID=UPI0036607441
MLVSPGRYRETVRVRTGHVTLRGTARDRVVIDGEGRRGTIEHNYASGSADSGIYVGQCKPCGILVRGNTPERNAVGYENTNASGPLWIVGNRFTGNRVGMTIGSDYLEALTPQTGATVAGNLIAGNAAADTPEQADGGYGIGLGIAGGRDNTITRNRITDHPRAGLILTSAEDLPPIDNRMTDNVFTANTLDAAYLATAHAPGSGNCFTGAFARTLPANLATAMACPARTAPAAAAQTLPATPPAPPWTALPRRLPRPRSTPAPRCRHRTGHTRHEALARRSGGRPLALTEAARGSQPGPPMNRRTVLSATLRYLSAQTACSAPADDAKAKAEAPVPRHLTPEEADRLALARFTTYRLGTGEVTATVPSAAGTSRSPGASTGAATTDTRRSEATPSLPRASSCTGPGRASPPSPAEPGGCRTGPWHPAGVFGNSGRMHRRWTRCCCSSSISAPTGRTTHSFWPAATPAGCATTGSTASPSSSPPARVHPVRLREAAGAATRAHAAPVTPEMGFERVPRVRGTRRPAGC